MQRLLAIAASFAVLAIKATAQAPDDATMQKMKLEMEKMVLQSKVVGLSGAVMGPTVKGAPYSGTEITESTQVLGDGTRIHNESETTVYRDSEGRVRRETPDQITIMDPVTGTSYFLDPKTQTARKVPLGTNRMFFVNKATSAAGGMMGGMMGGMVGGGPVSNNVEVRATTNDGVTSVTVNGKPVDPAALDQMKLRGEKLGMDTIGIEALPQLHTGGVAGAGPDVAYQKLAARSGEGESLGKQTVEGVVSEGTRHTMTLPAGAIGNDRPIQTVMERWYSPELQTLVMSKHSDPRTGEEIFRLTGVTRSEPAAYLFQVPAGYQIAERK